MSEICHEVLVALRLFGPCSNAEIGRQLKLPSHMTYGALQRLVAEGKATKVNLQTWEISHKGLQWFAAQPNHPVTLFLP